MFTIDAHLIALLKRGHITLEDAYLESRDNTLLNGYVAQMEEMQAKMAKVKKR